MRSVDINSRWADSRYKDRRVKVREVVTEDNVTYVYYGIHGQDTTYSSEISEFVNRFKSITLDEI